MLPSKWDLALESKPVPLLSHLVDELASLWAKELNVWPPQHIEATDDRTRAHFESLMRSQPDRPDAGVYREAFRLVRWELNRDFAASDDYFRNNRWAEAGLTLHEKPMLLFVSRFMIEHVLSLGDATKGRIDRQSMGAIVDRTERKLLSVVTL